MSSDNTTSEWRTRGTFGFDDLTYFPRIQTIIIVTIILVKQMASITESNVVTSNRSVGKLDLGSCHDVHLSWKSLDKDGRRDFSIYYRFNKPYDNNIDNSVIHCDLHYIKTLSAVRFTTQLNCYNSLHN